MTNIPTTAPGAGRALSGIGLMLAAMMILPVMDGTAKYLSLSLPVFMSVWARFFFQTAIAAPFVIGTHGPSILLANRPLFQAARSLCLVAANASFFWGLNYLPLADTLALFFISPILVTALSPLMLGEKVDHRRWLAVLAGFVGVLVIIRPGFSVINPGTGLGLLSGVLYAIFVLLTRQMNHVPVLVTTLYNSFFGAIALTLLAPLYWQWPDATQWLMLFAIGVISISAHYLLVASFQRAEASLLAPFAYSEMISGTLIGLWWFGDLPDFWTFFGAGILIASGLFISWNETRKSPEELVETP